jgi:hypothetical protein
MSGHPPLACYVAAAASLSACRQELDLWTEGTLETNLWFLSELSMCLPHHLYSLSQALSLYLSVSQSLPLSLCHPVSATQSLPLSLYLSASQSLPLSLYLSASLPQSLPLSLCPLILCCSYLIYILLPWHL